MELFVNDIIQSSSDNSAGTLLNPDAINNVVSDIINSHNLNKGFVDSLIDKYTSEGGYMIKANDFIYILSPYIIGDNLQCIGDEDTEKDYEIIELLYGDYHSECGDR